MKVAPYSFNVVVVGAGAGGLVTAAGSAGLGAKVALVEERAMGGDCLNFGCVPSKALLRSAKMIAYARRAKEFGFTTSPPVVDFAAVIARVKSIRSTIAVNDSVERFRGLGVDVFLGHGRFVSPHEVRVQGDGVDTTLASKRIVIATGTRPLVPPILGLAEAGYLTNETVFDLERLPAALCVLGGGPIGVELGQAFARFGSQVTIVEMLSRILPREDADASEALAARLAAEGVTILAGHTATRAETKNGRRVLYAKGPAGERAVECDEILVAVGRKVNLDGLDVEKAGIRLGPKGLELDLSLRTNVPHIFAVGDVAGPYLFTHTADYQARLAIRNALFPGNAKADYSAVPWATYTDPEVARVGLSEEEARQKGIPHVVFKVPMKEVDRALCDGEPHGFAKVLADPRSGTILGATIVGTHAGDILQEVVLAMRCGLPLSKISGTIHPYPTLAEACRKAADAFMRTKLTPGRKRLLERFFAWRR